MVPSEYPVSGLFMKEVFHLFASVDAFWAGFMGMSSCSHLKDIFSRKRHESRSIIRRTIVFQKQRIDQIEQVQRTLQ